MISFGLVVAIVGLMVLVDSAFNLVHDNRRTSTASFTRLFEQPDEWKGFNPLDPMSTLPKKHISESFGLGPDVESLLEARPEVATATSGSRRTALEASSSISLRRRQMAMLTEGLATSYNDKDVMLKILRANEAFLIEPLEDPEAVLERDSILTPDMDRTTRYATYRRVMDERLSNASSRVAKAVLAAMRDFVLSHE